LVLLKVVDARQVAEGKGMIQKILKPFTS